MRARGLSFFAAIAMAAVIGMFMSGCDRNRQPALKKGDTLPAVTLKSPGGADVTLPAGLKGSLNVLLFWSKGCHFCKREMPAMQPLYVKYKDKGFVFAAVHMGDEPEAVNAMIRDNGLTFPMYIDTREATARLYGIIAVPMMIVVDGNGVVKEKILGGLSAENLEKIVNENLK